MYHFTRDPQFEGRVAFVEDYKVLLCGLGCGADLSAEEIRDGTAALRRAG